MSKPRLKHNRSLPKRWVFDSNAYYYIVPKHVKHLWDNKSWFRLGSTLAEAHETFSKRLYTGDTKVVTMQDLLDRFQFEYIVNLAPATKRYYLYALPMVRKVFTSNPVPVALVEPHHAYQMTDYLIRTESRKKAKQAAECLSSALSFGVYLGAIKRNPLIGQFKKPATEGRNRKVTDKELIAFAQTLPRKWQLYIMFKLYTKGRRKAEILNVMRSDFLDEGIRFTNNKRKSDVFVVGWSPALRLVVTEILELSPAVTGDAPLFMNRNRQPYINSEGKTSGFDSIWQRYMTKAVKAGICAKFTEHDLRAKAVENETLEGAAKLLRHTSTQVTAKHYSPKPEQI